MPETNFPNGINIGDDASGTATFSIGGVEMTAGAAELNKVDGIGGAALAYTSAGKILAAGTVIVTGSTAIVPSGITTALFVVASPYGVAPSGAGTAGGFAAVSADLAGGGTVTIYAQDVQGTASSTAGTASYVVIGT